MNYYNENDKFASQWLRNLVNAKLIPKGHVDDRSITEVEPKDLDGYTQHHFFAGIAGWSRALELAGWPEDRPICTASLPCQPFSCAGKQKGLDDERHLWPTFYRLLKKRRFPIIVGEQVPAAIKLGWLDGIFNDLEDIGYTCGAVNLPACSVGAPHKRNRLFWCALGNFSSKGLQERGSNGTIQQKEVESSQGQTSISTSHNGRVADSEPQHNGTGESGQIRWGEFTNESSDGGQNRRPIRQTSPKSNFWHNSAFIQCADGKARRVPCRVAESEGVRLQESGQEPGCASETSGGNGGLADPKCRRERIGQQERMEET